MVSFSGPHNPTQNDDSSLLEQVNALEQLLSKAQARVASYEQILANINDAIIVLDSLFCIKEWNAAAEHIYGWSAAEACGQQLATLLRPRYLDNSTSSMAIQSALKDGAWNSLVAQRHRDGHEIIVEASVRTLFDAAGTHTGLVGINRDVTARYEAEQALRHSEAYLRAFFESASGAQYLLDTNYTVLAFNHVTAEQIERIWQKQVQVGDNVLDQVNPSNLDAFINYYQRCVAGEPNRIERRVVYPNGMVAWYELAFTPVIGSAGAVIGVAFSGQDITARKEAELALSDRDAQLAGIIDSAMDAIITADAQHQIVRFNRMAEQVFGCTAAEVLGQSIDRFLSLEAQANAALPTMSTPCALEAIRADGTRFPIEATISHINITGSIFYTFILRDITERKRLEDQFIQSQKLESVGRLAGGIAHDFNNLLTVIGGATELARMTIPADHPAQLDLEDVYTAADRAAALTQQLLAFARRQIYAPRVINVNTLITETKQLLRWMIGEHIEIVTNLLPDLASVHADPNQLQQVLLNVAVNARDAMPHGGQLTLTTMHIAPDSAAARTALDTQQSAHVRILIQDTGTGIAPEVLGRVFEPFFTTKPEGKGTGLGLSMCYGIIKQHDGAIWIDSTVGQGTSITIDLPVVHIEPKLMPIGEADRELPRGTEMVLLVEDEVSVRTLTARLLRGLGYGVIEAGDSAIAQGIMANGAQVDLLLTDLVMPGRGGLLLAAELSAAQPELKVVYMSGYAEYTDLEQLRNQSATIMQKPFSSAELAHTIRSVFDTK